MTIENCAVIVADFPDDGVETEDGNDFLIWPGRTIAEAICEILRGLGYRVEAPEHVYEHGWSFWSKASDGRQTWFQVTDIDEYLLITENHGGWGKSSVEAYAHLLTQLAAAFDADARFKSVRWSTLDEINIGPEPRPRFSLLEGGPVVAGEASQEPGGSRTADGALRSCAHIVPDLRGYDDSEGEFDPIGVGVRIAQAFCEILGGLGYATTPLVHDDARGWTFTATARDGYRAGFQMVHRGGPLLLTQNWGGRRGLFHMFSARKRAEADTASYADLLMEFAAALNRYPRFKSVRWCAEDEIGA
jgi:hypothetical protein